MGGSELRRRRAWPQPFLNAVVVRWWQRQGPQGCCQGCSHLACLGSGCCSTRSQDIERRGAAKWPTRLDKKRKTGRPSPVPPHSADRLQTPSERSNDSLGLGEPWRVSHPERVHLQRRGRGPKSCEEEACGVLKDAAKTRTGNGVRGRSFRVHWIGTCGPVWGDPLSVPRPRTGHAPLPPLCCYVWPTAARKCLVLGGNRLKSTGCTLRC